MIAALSHQDDFLTKAKLNLSLSTKPEPMSCAGLHSPCAVSEIHDGEDLWQYGSGWK